MSKLIIVSTLLLLSTSIAHSASGFAAAPSTPSSLHSEQYFSHESLIDAHSAVVTQKAVAQQSVKDLTAKQAKITQAVSTLQTATATANQVADESCAQKCTACMKKALPVIEKVIGVLATLAEAGVGAPGGITGNPTLTEAATIIHQSNGVLQTLGQQVQAASSAQDFLNAAANATALSLKVAANATGNQTLAQAGDAVTAASASLLNISTPTAGNVISALSASAQAALNRAATITGNATLNSIASTVGQAASVLSQSLGSIAAAPDHIESHLNITSHIDSLLS